MRAVCPAFPTAGRAGTAIFSCCVSPRRFAGIAEPSERSNPNLEKANDIEQGAQSRTHHDQSRPLTCWRSSPILTATRTTLNCQRRQRRAEQERAEATSYCRPRQNISFTTHQTSSRKRDQRAQATARLEAANAASQKAVEEQTKNRRLPKSGSLNVTKIWRVRERSWTEHAAGFKPGRGL